MKHLASMCICAMLLCGCLGTESLQQLRHASVSGSAFDRALADHYLRFAESELTKYDWWSVKHFADKGLKAAYGKPVEPERVESWNIPDYAVDELRSAQATLHAKLTDSYKRAAPKKAAMLQFSFDCWLEEQEEAWEEAAIEKCKNDFFRHLDETDRPVQVGGPFSTSLLLYFPWDSDEISGAATDELRDLAASLRGQGNFRIVINGHADRSGSDDYNLQLSARRADFIREFLEDQGVNDSRVNYSAFGESDPEIATPDGVREFANRRVEIFIE